MSARCLAVSVALGLAAAGVQAQASSKDETLDCHAADLAEQAWTACAYREFEAQDRELNTLYKRLVKQSDAESARQLQAAQRAWLQFRDLECVFESPDAAGSLGPGEKATCMAALTQERIADIRRSLR